MLRKIIITGMAAIAVALAGCGGGGSDSTSGNGGGSGQAASVAGPLDTVQTTTTNSVITPLENAAAGTPLAGVLACGNQAINGDLLNAADALISGVQTPATLSTTTTAQIQDQLTALTQNISGLLTTLASSSTGSTCPTGTLGSGSGLGGGTATNPLAGTPLASFGASVTQALQQLQTGLANSSGSSGGSGTSGVQTLATLYSTFNDQLQAAVGMLPSSTTSAPVVGGLLQTFSDVSADYASLLNAAAANDSSSFNAAAGKLVNDYLVDYLTLVVPTSYVETQAGQSGTVTNPIDQLAAQISSGFEQALATGSSQDILNALNSSQLSPIFDPVNNQLLPLIENAINSASAGGTGTGSGSLTGTPLDSILTPLITALQGLATTGTGAGTGTCPFAQLPLLKALCPAAS